MSALTPRSKTLALALLAMTQFVIVIDASIVNVALPSIGAHLHFSRDNLTWVVNAYTLTFGGFLLLGGRMADVLGRRRMFMLGLVVFSLASLAGGLAQSETWLIAARAVQGLGAAIVSPAALSIITTTFADGAERNRALGIWGAVAGAGGAAGVLLGGILTSGLSWRWVLFVNVPIALLAAALAPRTLDESRRQEAGNSFDIPGAVAVTAGLALLVYAVVDAVSVGWGATRTIVCLAGAVVLLIAFVAIERRQRDPLMPFQIFRLRTLRGANIVGLLIGMSLFSMFFFISLYLQDVLGYSPIKTGLAYLPLAIGIILSAGGRLPARHASRLQDTPDRRHAACRRRPAVVLPGARDRRLVRRGRPRPLPVGSRRVRTGVRARDDRRRHRDQATRGGPGLRSDQHLPAGRRRARARDPRDHRQQPHPKPVPRRRPQLGRGADQRL